MVNPARQISRGETPLFGRYFTQRFLQRGEHLLNCFSFVLTHRLNRSSRHIPECNIPFMKPLNPQALPQT